MPPSIQWSSLKGCFCTNHMRHISFCIWEQKSGNYIINLANSSNNYKNNGTERYQNPWQHLVLLLQSYYSNTPSCWPSHTHNDPPQPTFPRVTGQINTGELETGCQADWVMSWAYSLQTHKSEITLTTRISDTHTGRYGQMDRQEEQSVTLLKCWNAVGTK